MPVGPTADAAPRPAVTTFTFAHLSDIHFAGYESGAMFDVDSELRRELEYDLSAVVGSAGPLDAILIGGDIAGSGKREEYDAAGTWIEKLCSDYEVAVEKVYCVPGNHDVDWAVVNGDPVLKTLQDSLLTCRVEEFAPTLERLVSTGDHRALLLRGLDAYNEFAARYQCNFSLTEHRWEQVLQLGHLRLQIVGLASAIVSGPSDAREADKSRLALGPQGEIGRFDETFTVVLCHHPPGWLRDRAHVEHYLKRGHLQLYGHEHSFSVVESGAGVRVNAGAVHPERDGANWEPSYNVVVLRAEDGDPTVTVDIYPRRLLENRTFGPADQTERLQRYPIVVGLGTPPPDAPAEPTQPAPELTSVDERSLAHQFVALARDRRLALGIELGLLEESDNDLPEGVRLRRIFEVARKRNQLAQLKERMDSG